MATPLLITKSDFAGHVELSANMADAKINNRILEAQDFDLCGLMGDAFYWSFISNFNTDGTPKDSANADMLKLYLGGDYTFDSISYTFRGLKPVLVFYSASRLIKSLDMHLTPTGVMQKRNDFSDHVDSREISRFADQYESQAVAYWNMCEKYLDLNRTTFPLWKQGCWPDEIRSKGSPRISAVGANDDENFYNVGYGRRR